MLTKMNNEAKVRRLTKSLILGQAKVMSFEDIEVARAARAAKKVIKGKGKRGRKQKSAALEADEPEADKPEADEPEPEPEPEVARAAKEVVKGRGKRRKRKIAAQEAEEPEPEVARIIDAPAPWKAMEGISWVDDMRMLRERIENRFSIALVRTWFFRGTKSDTISVHSILGAIEEDRVIVRLQVISKQSLYRGQILNSNL
jgi:hypothetical protein